MKVCKDFVTNSSSSSFIISTNKEVPTQYKDEIKRVDNKNALDVIKQISDYEWTTISYEMDDDKFKELGNFTDEQISIIKLAICGELKTYQDLINHLEKEEDPIYHIFVDRDWLYYQDVLKNFIDEANLLEEKGDL